MDERVERGLNGVKDLEQLAQFEINVRRLNALTSEVETAIKARATDFSRLVVAKRTGIDLSELTPAQERIVQAVAEYVGVMKRRGKDATRTLTQLKTNGLLDAAEIAVAKAKPTQGFQTLKEEELEDLSYERIVVDHAEEFSARAIWFSRRTLGIGNQTEKPPARAETPTQLRTEALIKWMRERAETGGGSLGLFTNEDAAAAIGITDLRRYGRVFGNIVSRVDFACYMAGVPPLGLTAEAPFEKAWLQEGRSWPFPIGIMAQAAKSFVWQTVNFEAIVSETRSLSGQAHISWRNHLSGDGARVRAWAEGLESSSPRPEIISAVRKPSANTNPDWSREEHILALDLYLRLRGTSYSDGHPDVVALSKELGALAKLRGISGDAKFRNPNGVSMKMMNFRRFDPEYTASGRTGLPAGSKLESATWEEFADNRTELDEAIAAIREFIASGVSQDDPEEAPYWVFVCNPALWAIDRFLTSGVQHDKWGVRPFDEKRFAIGQLGLVRVGVDRRSATERNGATPLEPGVYALCEVESSAFEGTGDSDEFWAEGATRPAGWPTVRLRYIKNYLQKPLTIERLRKELPDISAKMLGGFQASSFPIQAKDFRAIINLLDENLEELPLSEPVPDTIDRLAALEVKYADASVEVKWRLSSFIERGPIGAEVKKLNGYKCQLCEALGQHPFGFKTSAGKHYVEAHHVMPVSARQTGSFSASNIMTLCANHHREMHYGDVDVKILAETFRVCLHGTEIDIPRTTIVSAIQLVEDPPPELRML